jgi:hypothetical protein
MDFIFEAEPPSLKETAEELAVQPNGHLSLQKHI